jgi:hypothetical protein
MNANIGVDLLVRARLAHDPQTVDQLAAHILDLREDSLRTLVQVALALDCQPLLRCAALDQYFHLARPTGGVPDSEARGLITRLTGDSDENVRAAAYQWQAWLQTNAREGDVVVKTRGGGPVSRSGTRAGSPGGSARRGGQPAGDWRVQVLSDVSPRVRWLGQLEH